MGRLIYSTGNTIEIDDRTLAHIRIVTMAKLRRGEPFALTWDIKPTEHHGFSTIWVHPAVPIQFDFFGSREPVVNRLWLEQMMLLANTPAGLRFIPEPVAVPASEATTAAE